MVLANTFLVERWSMADPADGSGGPSQSDRPATGQRRPGGRRGPPANPFPKGNKIGKVFKKGEPSANPGGLTKAERILGDAYKAVLEGRWTPERLAAGLDAGAEAAAAGDIGALRLMLDRTVGPIPDAPKTQTNIQINVTKPVTSIAPATEAEWVAEAEAVEKKP